jgi:acyl dehydratase
MLTEEVRAFIGREATYTAPEELGRAAIRYFALAIGDDNAVYIDDEAARDAGHLGVIAPPTLICESNQYLHREPDGNGFMGHTWDLPVRNARLVRGSNDYEFDRPVFPTDRITVTWFIEDIQERTSSSGVPMLVVTSVAVYHNQEGERLATNTETLIYQPLDAAS